MKTLFIAILMINTSWAAGSKHCLPSVAGKPSFCTGEKVIVDDGLQNSIGREGKIVTILESTTSVEIKFKDGGANQTLPLNNVADIKEHQLPTGFDYPSQPGMDIVSDTGLDGRIVGRFLNGDAEVKFLFDNDRTHRWPLERLAVSNISYCTSGYTWICWGDYVAGRNQSEGKVIGVFEGTPYVMVHFIDKKSRKEKPAKAYKVNSNDLVVTLKCHDNGLCNHL